MADWLKCREVANQKRSNLNLVVSTVQILAERAWCICSQSSLLNIYFRVSGFQSSVLLIIFDYAPNTCSACCTEPIPYVTLQSEIAPLLKSHRNHCSCA